MAAAAVGLNFIYSALLLQAFGAYVSALSTEFGWSKTALAVGAAIQSIEGAVLGPVMGWLIDRYGPRVMVRLGMVTLSLGFAALSTVQTLTGFYMAMAVIAVGTSFSGYFPLSVALMHWFQRRRARALSLMNLGFAAGGLAVPLVAWAMEAHGWRQVALASSIIVAVLGWPLAAIIRNKPADVGETVDGVPASAPAVEQATTNTATNTASRPVREFSAAQAVRTRAFWLLGLGHAFALLVVTAVNVHAISHMKEGLGYSLAQSGVVITLMTLAQAGGVLLGAAIGDRWSKRYVAAACMLGHMLGLLMLAYASHPVMLGLFAIFHGVAWGLRGPFMQAMRADYFGLRAIGMIMGLSAIIVALGQIAGPLIAGAMADWTGNYRAGFTMLALVAGSGCVLFLMARRPG